MSNLRLARTKLEQGVNCQDQTCQDKFPVIDGELLVGLTINEAQNKYPGIIIRPCVIDGQNQSILLNYNIHRYNVHTVDGIISKFVTKA